MRINTVLIVVSLFNVVYDAYQTLKDIGSATSRSRFLRNMRIVDKDKQVQGVLNTWQSRYWRFSVLALRVCSVLSGHGRYAISMRWVVLRNDPFQYVQGSCTDPCSFTTQPRLFSATTFQEWSSEAKLNETNLGLQERAST